MLYTERHGMRAPIQKTYDISIKAYSLLFDCCRKYWIYLAWKYPEECPDGNGCCGINLMQFNESMEYEIPSLFRREEMIAKPLSADKAFDAETQDDEYDQYALLDLIEYVARNVRDISHRTFHGYYRHEDITFGATNDISGEFISEINDIFDKTGVLYQLTTALEIERVEEASVLSTNIENNISVVKELGLKELLQISIQKHKSPYLNDVKDAVEKIWDALERLKTYYTSLDKKDSVNQIINDMSNRQADYYKIFEAEFRALTDIGNNFRIRHHETSKIDISDMRHYDYFFNRCLSLIASAIQFLK